MPEIPRHNPDLDFFDPDLEGEKKKGKKRAEEKYVPEEPESQELSLEEKETLLRLAQSLKSIYVKKPDGKKIDKKKTREEREKLIAFHSLRDTARYTRYLVIRNDEQGLPILTAKE